MIALTYGKDTSIPLPQYIAQKAGSSHDHETAQIFHSRVLFIRNNYTSVIF
jgi:hypothetical protein